MNRPLFNAPFYQRRSSILSSLELCFAKRVFSSCVTYKLPSNVSQIFNYKIKNFYHEDPYENHPYIFKHYAKELCKLTSFPVQLKDLAEKGKPNVMLIEGIPIDENLPPTPNDEETPRNKSFVSEYSILAMASFMGCHVYEDVTDKNGKIIHNVIPISGKEHERSSRGSLTNFSWHTENPHDINPPDIFILLSLRVDKNAQTNFIILEDLLNNLPSWVKEAILKNDFSLKTGPTYSTEVSNRLPLLEWKNSNWCFRYEMDSERCIGLTPEAREAVKYLHSFLTENQSWLKKSVTLMPGQALVFNNRVALHSRNAFVSSNPFDERRWLQRCNLRKKVSLAQNKQAFFSAACSDSNVKQRVIVETSIESKNETTLNNRPK